MPYAPPTRCRCGQPATRRGRCANCQPAAWSNPSPNTLTLTGRDRARFRDTVLKAEPQCRYCGATSNLEADHIIPIAEGGAHDPERNGQTLCRDCHRRKTATERARARARRG